MKLNRARITQVFPFLLPLRITQKKACFYTKMLLDQNRYARLKATEPLPVCIYKSETWLINEQTGFDTKYQENKVFNLKLAAEPLNNLLIRPGETFSFWQLVRLAEKAGIYKEALAAQDGKLVTVTGGGLCHLSNFLFWMFLHTPLTVTERHPHMVKYFPSADEGEPDGVDAAVNEGWLDLKVQNRTDTTFQLSLRFEETYLCGSILADKDSGLSYHIISGDRMYYKSDGKIYERVSVFRHTVDSKTRQFQSKSRLYTDTVEIKHPLPQEITVLDRKG